VAWSGQLSAPASRRTERLATTGAAGASDTVVRAMNAAAAVAR